ncbi:hypothetical protein ACFFX0_26250 [Citricoccus parietis]|uniref:Uncharacterized protein n=1 Tax=Citricoccus parietis TaxID=592307 RepID=A0ABV5G6C7_9MICC
MPWSRRVPQLGLGRGGPLLRLAGSLLRVRGSRCGSATSPAWPRPGTPG